MKKAILKIFVFSILFLIILSFFNKVFLKKELLRTRNIYNLKEDIDVLFIGSSHVYSTIDTEVIDFETHTNSFILATPSQNISQTYFLLKEFLKYKKPKLVFLESYSLKEDIGDEYAIHAAYDGMNFSINKLEAAFYSSISRDSLNLSLFSDIIFPIFKYHNRWNSELSNNDFTYFKNESLNKGSQLFPQNDKKFLPNNVDYFDYSLDTINKTKNMNIKVKSSFDKIVNLCKFNNIKLIIFSTPHISHSHFSVTHNVKVLNSIRNDTVYQELDFLDFNLKYRELGLNYYDLRDNHHLKESGAKKVNSYLTLWIKENFNENLPNRKKERSWYNYIYSKNDKRVLFEKDLNLKVSDSVLFKNIAFLEQYDEQYVFIELNDSLPAIPFPPNIRVMMHAFPEKEQINLLPDNRKEYLFDNWDFKPKTFSFENHNFLFSKLSNPKNKIKKFKYINLSTYSPQTKKRSEEKKIQKVVFN